MNSDELHESFEFTALVDVEILELRDELFELLDCCGFEATLCVREALV
jgi:hypothetical protein